MMRIFLFIILITSSLIGQDYILFMELEYRDGKVNLLNIFKKPGRLKPMHQSKIEHPNFILMNVQRENQTTFYAHTFKDPNKREFEVFDEFGNIERVKNKQSTSRIFIRIPYSSSIHALKFHRFTTIEGNQRKSKAMQRPFSTIILDKRIHD